MSKRKNRISAIARIECLSQWAEWMKNNLSEKTANLNKSSIFEQNGKANS